MTCRFGGAGNLLGQQQSGFIDSVGFDLYSQMLQEAVARKQGGPAVEKTFVEIDVDVDAYIPSDYVNDERQKLNYINVFVRFQVKKNMWNYKMNLSIVSATSHKKWMTYSLLA